jgi:hypothetical protein
VVWENQGFKMIYFDFETRSECDLKRAGAWKYSLDPTTEVLCYAWKSERGVFSVNVIAQGVDWTPANVYSIDIEAHNASFEFAIWHNIMVPRYGWPDVPLERWHCSAAKAASYGLPRSLDGATAALGLSEAKDKAGHKLMLKLCKPRPWWTKYGRGDKYSGTIEEFERLEQYCRQDVRAEYALSQALDDLSDKERRIWCLDQVINRRGVQADLTLVNKCIELAAVNEAKGKEAITELTDGEVTSPNQVAKLKDWCNRKDFEWRKDRPDDLLHSIKIALIEYCSATFSKPKLTHLTIDDDLVDLETWIDYQMRCFFAFGIEHKSELNILVETEIWRLLTTTHEKSQQKLLIDLSAQTVETALKKDNLSSEVRQALELRQAHSKSSVKKYLAMRDRACDDGRIRETLLYHGAHTGRWTGVGIQPQNYPRPSMTRVEIENIIIPDIIKGDTDDLELMAGSISNALSDTLRSALVAGPGMGRVWT